MNSDFKNKMRTSPAMTTPQKGTISTNKDKFGFRMEHIVTSEIRSDINADRNEKSKRISVVSFKEDKEVDFIQKNKKLILRDSTRKDLMALVAKDAEVTVGSTIDPGDSNLVVNGFAIPLKAELN